MYIYLYIYIYTYPFGISSSNTPVVLPFGITIYTTPGLLLPPHHPEGGRQTPADASAPFKRPMLTPFGGPRPRVGDTTLVFVSSPRWRRTASSPTPT